MTRHPINHSNMVSLNLEVMTALPILFSLLVFFAINFIELFFNLLNNLTHFIRLLSGTSLALFILFHLFSDDFYLRFMSLNLFFDLCQLTVHFFLLCDKFLDLWIDLWKPFCLWKWFLELINLFYNLALLSSSVCSNF